MKLETLEPFPINSNPFDYDLFRMGVEIKHEKSYGWMVMYGDDKNELVIVDTITGERIKIERSIK